VIAALALLQALVAPPAGAASASTTPTILVAPAVGPPTTTTTVTGKGFGVYETVDLSFDSSSVGTATTDPLGRFASFLTIPTSALPGNHVVSALGESSGRTASVLFLVRTDWTKDRFDLGNTGFNPYENVLDPANVSTLTLAWSAGTGGTVWGLALSGGVLYMEEASHGTTVSALDAETGSVMWSRRMKHWGTLSGVTYHGGSVYFGTDNYVFHSLDAHTGTRRWDTPVLDIPGSAAVWADTGYFSTPIGITYALDSSTGVEVWSHRGAGAGGVGTPAVAHGLVYEANDRSVLALDATTGALVWSYQTGGLVEDSVAAWKNTVFVPSEDGFLYALDATTGAPRWKAHLGPPTYGGAFAPAIANGVVYASYWTNRGGSVQALDAATGMLLWKDTASHNFGRVVVANGVVYLGGDAYVGEVYAVDAATGTKRWTYDAGGSVIYGAVVANGMLYTGSLKLDVFHLSAGLGSSSAGIGRLSG
jgi:outer membrane protein assembly factor BamB